MTLSLENISLKDINKQELLHESTGIKISIDMSLLREFLGTKVKAVTQENLCQMINSLDFSKEYTNKDFSLMYQSNEPLLALRNKVASIERNSPHYDCVACEVNERIQAIIPHLRLMGITYTTRVASLEHSPRKGKIYKFRRVEYVYR